jgi:hypothetical protein
MNNTLTKYIFFQIVCQPCTPPMYINHVHKYHKIYHKISQMECINHMPITCANCVPSICFYQYANHVPQTSVISLMVCLHHGPSAITMHLNQSSVSTISSHISCTKVYAKQVIPIVYFSQVLSSTYIYYP